MSTDAICTCSHGLGVLRHADDCPVAVERRRPVALSAPSEPVQDQPRVWAMPEIPEDVTAVLDCAGWRWERVGEIWRVPGEVEGVGFTRTVNFTWIAEADLLEQRSPLTEVVGPDGD